MVFQLFQARNQSPYRVLLLHSAAALLSERKLIMINLLRRMYIINLKLISSFSSHSLELNLFTTAQVTLTRRVHTSSLDARHAGPLPRN